MDVQTLLDRVAANESDYLGSLEAMVNVDCGSYTADGVDRIADMCAERFRARGWDVERRAHFPVEGEQRIGDLVIGRLRGAGGTRVLLVGHMDTVFDEGTAALRPFRKEGDRAYGPGVSDMKGGLLAGFAAVDALQDAGFDGFGEITYVCNPDEEIGSPFSGPVIRELAPSNDVAFVLECARANGDIVSARKGITDFVIRFHGRAAHAGVEPDKGRNAILEAAHKAIAIQALHRRWEDVTVNVGVLHGGTRLNVVPELAELQVDVRSPRLATLEEAEREIERICREQKVPGVGIEALSQGWHRPMEKTEASQRLVDVARDVASELGFSVKDTATGGASDGNTTSGAGTPTLDGLGPIGGDPHAPSEWLDLSSVVPRVALLAGLIARA
jgi:glutamate carboxypeptidase